MQDTQKKALSSLVAALNAAHDSGLDQEDEFLNVLWDTFKEKQVGTPAELAFVKFYKGVLRFSETHNQPMISYVTINQAVNHGMTQAQIEELAEQGQLDAALWDQFKKQVDQEAAVGMLNLDQVQHEQAGESTKEVEPEGLAGDEESHSDKLSALDYALLRIIGQDLGHGGPVNETHKQADWLAFQVRYVSRNWFRSVTPVDVTDALSHLRKVGMADYCRGYWAVTAKGREALQA